MIGCVSIGFTILQCLVVDSICEIYRYVKTFDVFLLFMLAITDLAYVVSKCLKSQCDIFHSN